MHYPMIRPKHIIVLYFFIVSMTCAQAQSLLDLLNEENAKNKDTLYTEAIFKSTRMINGQSIETGGRNILNIMISHRFGNVNSGVKEMFGLDHSFVRLGVEYGLTDRIDLGLGRSSDQKLVDSYFKWKIIRQSSGVYNVPVSIAWYSNASVSLLEWEEPNRDNLFSSRMYYVHELLVARKMNSKLSMQLSPGVVHRNLVADSKAQNDVPFVGISARYKLNARIAVSMEYYYILPGEIAKQTENSLSIGVDIETGGHVFQLHFSNNRGMTEKYIPDNLNSWSKSQFGFGFNIKRQFNLNRKY